MALVDTRLTLFAVLSSMEEDLRQIIIDQISPQTKSVNELLGIFYDKCLQRYVDENESNSVSQSAAELLKFSDLGDLYQIINSHSSVLPQVVAQYFREKTKELESFVAIRNRVMHIRPLAFEDLPTVLAFADRIQNDMQIGWVQVRNTVKRLTEEPQYVLGLKMPVPDTGPKRHNLPSPDFDDTGFLGRKADLAQLHNLCRGTYPVMTLLGVGGIGKSALAVKLAYELLDDPARPFDAIVWSSSKTTILTGAEIQNVKNAITDSLGLIQAVATELTGTNVHNPIDEVLEYLAEFRVLVILDNLETVLDERVRAFLQQLPMGSKVIITSRVGVGAYDYPVKLEPLSKDECILLMRSLATTRGLKSLVEMSNKDLAVYCARLKHNPGFIKWFIAAVCAGTRAEDALAKPDTFLDFCMSNVYEYLSEGPRYLLRCMMISREQHNQAELAFVSDSTPDELQLCLKELISANMITVSPVVSEGSYVTQYGLANLAQLYLSRNYPVKEGEYEKIASQLRQLTAIRESTVAESGDPFSIYTIRTRSRGDLVVAKYLLGALHCTKRKEFDAAEQFVKKARQLSPDYFEVHRVDAWVQNAQKNIAAAQASYEAAVELNAESPSLRNFYGGFLLRINQTEEAVKQLRRGLELDPGAVPIRIEMARAELYLYRFDESLKCLQPLLDAGVQIDVGERHCRKAWDLALQVHRRRGELEANAQDYSGAITSCERFRDVWESCPAALRDERMRHHLKTVEWIAMTASRTLSDSGMKLQATSLAEWCQSKDYKVMPALVPNVIRQHGKIVRVIRDRQFAFLKSDDGTEWYFHRNNLDNAAWWCAVVPDVELTFKIGANELGRCATEVRIISSVPKQERRGVVARRFHEYGYGFIKADDETEWYFRKHNLNPVEWEDMVPGTLVRFTPAENEKGPMAVDVKITIVRSTARRQALDG